MNDIFWIWQAAGLLIISYTRIQTKFNDMVAKFEGAKKWAKVHKKYNDTSFRGMVGQDL